LIILKVTILDNDHSGVFSFNEAVEQVSEEIGEYFLKVYRFCGARGRVSIPYRTIELTAKDGEDFLMTEGNLIFENIDTVKEIPLTIINNSRYEINTTFEVEIDEPKREDVLNNQMKDDGAPRLGELTRCSIRIRESRKFKATVDSLI